MATSTNPPPPTPTAVDVAAATEWLRRFILSEDERHLHCRVLAQLLATTRTTAVAEERATCAAIVEAQPFYPDTHTGTRQQWVKDQIAEAIRARGTE